MFSISIYSLAIGLTILSWFKNKKKTKMALKKAWKSFENILPQLSAILLLIGFALAVLNPSTISYFMGEQSGAFGVVFAALIGSVTLIPGFVAFPLAAALLKSGAGYMQIGAFVSTLMMVGVITIPMEVSYFGKKATAIRNLLALGFSFIVAVVVGGVMSL